MISHKINRAFGGIGGLVIEFTINGELFTRCSIYGKLAFWKRDNKYMNKEQCIELDSIIKNYIAGNNFKELLEIRYEK